jgi:hypothetical protein
VILVDGHQLRGGRVPAHLVVLDALRAFINVHRPGEKTTCGNREGYYVVVHFRTLLMYFYTLYYTTTGGTNILFSKKHALKV